jgi:hypothetical protein
MQLTPAVPAFAGIISSDFGNVWRLERERRDCDARKYPSLSERLGAHPGRFAIVKPVDPDDPAVADVVPDWKNTPGAVEARASEPGLDRILRPAVRHDFPVNILCRGT